MSDKIQLETDLAEPKNKTRDARSEQRKDLERERNGEKEDRNDERGLDGKIREAKPWVGSCTQ